MGNQWETQILVTANAAKWTQIEQHIRSLWKERRREGREEGGTNHWRIILEAVLHSFVCRGGFCYNELC